jgi:hypothetical protein
MGQPGFFDFQHRCEGLDAHSDPLANINAALPFEMFRLKLKIALIKDRLRRSEADCRGAAGRIPRDQVLIFRVPVLQALYNLSDDQRDGRLLPVDVLQHLPWNIDATGGFHPIRRRTVPRPHPRRPRQHHHLFR